MELFGKPMDGAGKPVDSGPPVSLERWANPVGSKTFDLTDRSMLQLADGGGLLLGLTAGDPDRNPDITSKLEEFKPTDAQDKQGKNSSVELDEIKSSRWQIVNLALELTARIPPEPSTAAAAAGSGR
jgi:hypothetical protein